MHQHFQGCSHGYELKEGWALAYLSFLKVSHLGQVLPVGSVASAWHFCAPGMALGMLEISQTEEQAQRLIYPMKYSLVDMPKQRQLLCDSRHTKLKRASVQLDLSCSWNLKDVSMLFWQLDPKDKHTVWFYSYKCPEQVSAEIKSGHGGLMSEIRSQLTHAHSEALGQGSVFASSSFWWLFDEPPAHYNPWIWVLLLLPLLSFHLPLWGHLLVWPNWRI